MRYILWNKSVIFFYNTDMNVTELFLVNKSGSAHHNILRALVHGERNNFSYRVNVSKKHNHSVHSGCYSCVRGSAVTERIVHCWELCFYIVLAKSNYFERLYHKLGIVVTNRA